MRDYYFNNKYYKNGCVICKIRIDENYVDIYRCVQAYEHNKEILTIFDEIEKNQIEFYFENIKLDKKTNNIITDVLNNLGNIHMQELKPIIVNLYTKVRAKAKEKEITYIHVLIDYTKTLFDGAFPFINIE